MSGHFWLTDEQPGSFAAKTHILRGSGKRPGLQEGSCDGRRPPQLQCRYSVRTS